MYSMQGKRRFKSIIIIIFSLTQLSLSLCFLRAPWVAPWCNSRLPPSPAATASAAAAARKAVICLFSLNPQGQSAAAAEEYLRLRNTFCNLADFKDGQEVLQQQEQQELQQQREAAAAAAEYKRIKHKRQQAHKQSRKKEIYLSARIAEGDLQQKARKARELLLEKHQVKFVLQLRGRERANPQSYLPLLQQLQQMLQDVGRPAAQQQNKGNSSALTLFLQPCKRNNPKTGQQQQQGQQRDEQQVVQQEEVQQEEQQEQQQQQEDSPDINE